MSVRKQLWQLKKRLTSKPEKAEIPTHANVLYHAVGDPEQHAGMAANLHLVSQACFRAQLRMLRGQGYSFISIDEATVLPPKPGQKVCTITFDDGYRSVHEVAVPVLEELQIPATFYLTTTLLEGNVLWRDKVRTVIDSGWEGEFLDAYAAKHGPMLKEGEKFYRHSKAPGTPSKQVDEALDAFLQDKNITLSSSLYITPEELKESDLLSYGNHTHRHYTLASLSPEEQAEEIQTAEKKLQAWGVTPSRVFAAPFGNDGTYNEATFGVLKDLGYVGLASCGGNMVRNATFEKRFGLTLTNRFLASNEPTLW
ncbi:MAG: polysaccharide deacetylase family protein [Bacteroidota bacterium]